MARDYFDSERNEQASLMIMQNLALSPRSQGLSELGQLVADEALQGYDNPEAAVTLRDIGAIRPDMIPQLPEVANRLHEAFGIPHRVTTKEANGMVTLAATLALDAVKSEIIAVRHQQGAWVPYRIKHARTAEWGDDYKVHAHHGDRLHNYLLKRPDTLRLVRDGIHNRAQQVRSTTEARQRAVARTHIFGAIQSN